MWIVWIEFLTQNHRLVPDEQSLTSAFLVRVAKIAYFSPKHLIGGGEERENRYHCWTSSTGQEPDPPETPASNVWDGGKFSYMLAVSSFLLLNLKLQVGSTIRGAILKNYHTRNLYWYRKYKSERYHTLDATWWLFKIKRCWSSDSALSEDKSINSLSEKNMALCAKYSSRNFAASPSKSPERQQLNLFFAV